MDWKPPMFKTLYDGNDYTIEELKQGIKWLQDELATRDNFEPLWRTKFTVEEQDMLAEVMMEELRDCITELAHEALDSIDGLNELAAMIVDLHLLDNIFKTEAEAPYDKSWAKTDKELEELNRLERLGYIEHHPDVGINQLPGYAVTPQGRQLLEDYYD